MEQEKKLDRWEQALVERKIELEAHFKELGIKTALDCPDFPECPIHKAYIKAVYESMSKGAGGGFEF